MSGYKYLKASDGTGPAVLAHVTTDRSVASSALLVDSVDNWPPFFIATSGDLGTNGFITPASVTEFAGHLSGPNIEIDDYMPGSSDTGHTTGQVVIIKQTTGFADSVVEQALVSHNDDGSLKDEAVNDPAIISDDLIPKAKLALDAKPGLRPYTITSTATLAPNLDNYTSYEVTAQAAALAISAPTGTFADKAIILFFVKDNGTARAITWDAAYVNISGLDALTTTTVNKWSVVGCVYNASAAKWQIVSITTEA